MSANFARGGFIPEEVARVLNSHSMRDGGELIIPIEKLEPRQRHWWAQHREDKIAAGIFHQIGVTNRVAVEFGAMDGRTGSNTAYFRDEGWTAHLFDIEPGDPSVTQAEITAENVNAVFAWHGVPQAFDLLSLDIDGNDLWVWQALTYAPRVVIIEYNPKWAPHKSRTVKYDPARRWDLTDYYGASVLALCRLGAKKGYDLVASTKANLIFVRAGLLPAIAPESVVLRVKRKPADPQRRKWVAYA